MTEDEKKFLRAMTDSFKSLTLQIVSYKEAIERLRKNHPHQAELVDKEVQLIAKSPDVNDTIRRQYDNRLEEFFRQSPASLSDSKAMTLLQEFFQKNPPKHLN